MIFYYTDLSQLGSHILAMLGLSLEGGRLVAAGFTDPVTMAVIRKYTVLPLIAIIACTPIVPSFGKIFKNKDGLIVNFVGNVFYIAAIILSLLFIIGQSYNPFIYFRF